MAKFVTIGERLSTTAPAVNKAFTERDPEPIIKRAKQQLDAGATYLDVNIGVMEAGRFGIRPERAVNYVCDEAGTENVYGAVMQRNRA